MRNLFLLMAITLSACANAPTTLPTRTATLLQESPTTTLTPTPVATKTPLSYDGKSFRLKTTDEIELFAKQWVAGDTWIILSSNGDGRSERWQPLVDELRKTGYSILTYDWRGTNASIGGATDWQSALKDARAALQFARDNGARRIVLIGGSLGGIASIKLGSNSDVSGVVSLGAPYRAESLSINENDLNNIKSPKLFITSSKDSIVSPSEVQWLYDHATAPKSIHIYEDSAHGVDLLNSVYRDDLVRRIVEFVIAVAPMKTTQADAWREDLTVLAFAIRQGHPKAFYKNNESSFNSRVQQLYDNIPKMDANQIKAGLMRICAMFDGHTRIFFGQSAMDWHLYDFRLYQFSDGVFVIQSDLENNKYVGAEIVNVNGQPIKKILDQLSEYIEHDNEYWLKFLAPTYLLLPELLQEIGVINDIAHPNFELRMRDGTLVNVNPPVISPSEFRSKMPLFQLPIRPEMTWTARRTESFWMTTLANGDALYIQYNQVRDTNKNGSLYDFVQDALKIFQQTKAKRVILDIRQNGGGDNHTYGPLLIFLMNELINQPGKLYVLSGRNTFSAASNFLTEVETRTKAIIVGEPMGSSPNLYGDTRTYTLPNSKIEAWISTRYWEKSSPTDKRTSIEPHIKVELSSKDWFAGRDPVLETALAHTA